MKYKKMVTADATIVTAFINLHKYDKEKRPVRSESQYIQDGLKVLHLDIPMVIYVEKENYHKILKYRIAAGLLEKTVMIAIDFMNERDIPTNKWRSQMDALYLAKKENYDNLPQAAKWIFGSNKNTVNYHILTYSKLDFVSRAIKLNPFNSSRFVWLDFGISYVADQFHEIYNWIHHIPDKIRILQQNKFHTGATDTIAQYSQLEQGECSSGGGVLTGNIEYWKRFHSVFIETAKHTMDNGYLFLEEAIFCYLMFKHGDDLFDPYYGCYTDICRNYLRPTSIYSIPQGGTIDYIFININRCLMYNDQINALRALRFIEPAIINIEEISHDNIGRFIEYYLLAKWYVEPRGILDDHIIRFIAKILRSDSHKQVAERIRSLGYINTYANNAPLLQIIGETSAQWRD